MLTITISDLKISERQNWLQYAIAPRPVAFASTIDKEGNVNLSPFSFFNLFSINPSIAIFSPARRGRDNTTKHTLQNVQEVPEVVIHICDFDMIQQMNLTSCEYPKGVDEFIKAGFTKQQATMVRPPMIAEAKVKFECRVIEIKSLGEQGGAGQLVFAEILLMHVEENILNAEGTMIDPYKLQQIARLGGDWYTVVNENNLFKLAKPNTKLGIGVDALPNSIRSSKILSGNDLGQLANVNEMPFIDATFEDATLKNIILYYSLNPEDMENELHHYAKKLLLNGSVKEAWQVLLASCNFEQ